MNAFFLKLTKVSTLLIFSIVLFNACSSKKIDENNPTDLLGDAEDDIKSKQYTVALEKLKGIRNKFPYSHLATQAQLRMADVYFLEESYIEAASSYESFRDLHPKHPKADYVIFRIGESHFKQLPGGIDRDLTPATRAIAAFEELTRVYPNSEYVAKTTEHLNEAKGLLVKKEKYVADFYFRSDNYLSAAKRYEKIISQFPSSEFEEFAYLRWGKSLYEYSKILTQELKKKDEEKNKKEDLPELADAMTPETLYTEAKHVYRTYISRYPTGTYARQIGDWLDEHNAR